METEMNSYRVNSPIEIPNKSTFKINEVCALTGIKSYVLRFWESEFEEIAPVTSSSGHKLYEQKDIEAILLIKKLLFEDKHSVERARVEIKKLIVNNSLIDTMYEAVGLSENDNSTESCIAIQQYGQYEVAGESQESMNYSNKYDVKKLDPDVIQTLKDKFMTSSESTLEILEKSIQAKSEAGISDQENSKNEMNSTPRFTVRTLSDVEFRKLLEAKNKLNQMLNFLENNFSA